MKLSVQNVCNVNSGDSYKEYDICVITAANDYQAQGYQKQLQWRKDKGTLSQTEFFVFADPQGKRIGSGGSTIYVLYKLLEHFCNNEKYQSPEEVFKGYRGQWSGTWKIESGLEMLEVYRWLV